MVRAGLLLKEFMMVDLDWNSLGFSYRDTRSHIRYTWRDGEWDSGELVTDPYFSIHVAATALHYGQAAFEGLKAFSCKDGKVRVFRADENAARLQTTAQRIMMQQVPTELFIEAVHRVVADNVDYVPPYGSGGALYIRPLLFGSGARIGVQPADEFTFIVLVIPVGDYYKGGLSPVDAIVLDGYDRAAPHGVGGVKVAGNYAQDMVPNTKARGMGYPINLYLDAATRTYLEEFGTSNFIGITKDGRYVTPDSPSILRSITNKTLMQLAADQGLTVEQRPVKWEEVYNFTEAAACGTAVVLTPVRKIVRGEEEVTFGDGANPGPVCQALYKRVREIQTGEVDDPHGWNCELRK
jgi:branched-chain amino acid aminotransferase